MDKILLYSTNTFVKYTIRQEYYGDVHYVWCSEWFDPSKQDQSKIRNMVAESSNPASIYRNLLKDVISRDKHSYKITEQKTSIGTWASQDLQNGILTEDAFKEIIYLVENCELDMWRPVLYVTPYSSVMDRAKKVDPERRASHGNEYIISDLKGHEFHILEFHNVK